jgi:DNA-binding NarL/FixJ family response regulator
VWNVAKVLIIEDDDVIARGMARHLETAGFDAVGVANGETGLARLRYERPDVCVLDARLPDGTGIEVCRDVRSVDPSLNCIILTSFDDEQALRGAVLAGASGYVLKEIGGTDLIGALRRAAAGESIFAEGVAAGVVDSLVEAEDVDPRTSSLTPQERRVLELVGGGLTNRQIAAEMFLAEKTVKNYVSSLLAKLGFERRTQAAVFIAGPASPAPPVSHAESNRPHSVR